MHLSVNSFLSKEQVCFSLRAAKKVSEQPQVSAVRVDRPWSAGPQRARSVLSWFCVRLPPLCLPVTVLGKGPRQADTVICTVSSRVQVLNGY